MARRLTTLVAVAALAFSMMAGVAAAEEHPPLHGHVRLLHAEWSGPGVGPETVLHSYGKCIDLAAGQALPLQSHHDRVHTGRAGAALRGAGHLTIPTAPLSGIQDCAHLATFLPPR